MYKYFEAVTSDKAILKKDILRMLIQKKAETLLDGKYAVVIKPMDSLDIQLDIPAATYLEAQNASEGTNRDNQKLEFFELKGSMDKYETGFIISHETKARQLQTSQVSMSVNACARGLAIKQDSLIFSGLSTGKGGTAAAAAKWSAAAATPAIDIANAIGEIVDNTYVTKEDMNNIGIFYPAKLWTHLQRPVEIDNIQKSLQNWAQQEYKVNFYPTRQLSTTALCVLRSEETAIQAVYTGKDVPQAFEETDSDGDSYTFTNYFKTLVVPESSGGTTNNRIREITTVA